MTWLIVLSLVLVAIAFGLTFMLAMINKVDDDY